MHDCCSYSGTDSFISVIDHLPRASSPFLCISVWIFTPPPPARSRKKKWHARFCSLSVCASHFFIIPRSIDRSSSSSVRTAARPLTPWQPTPVWRQAGSALSADPDVLQQPLSRRLDGRSELLTVEGGEGEKKRITSFTIPTWERESKHQSAWWRRVTVGFDQSHNSSSITPVTNISFQFMSYIWSHNQRKFIMHGSNYAWK